MKGIRKLGLAFLMVLTATFAFACGDGVKEPEPQATYNDQTTVELYQSALTAMGDNFTTQGEITMVMKVDEGNGKRPVSYPVVMQMVSKIHGENEYAQLLMSGVVSGQAEVWYINGWLYDGSSKEKEEVSREDFEDEYSIGIDAELETAVLAGLADGYFLVYEDRVTLTCTLSGDAATQAAQAVLEQQLGSGVSATVDEIDCLFTFGKDGQLKIARYTFTMQAVLQGQSVQYNYNIKMKYSDIGTTQVSLPDDADKYVDKDTPVVSNPDIM